ncbi:tetratricopeptide repeat protein [Nocardioides sp. NPDC006303]|uniref:tetratricopeptide repeat protein n=1 Tax=Nocardioides sp. NPDC006303 TaxID=3156747 RepID=UPI0033AB33C7
MTDDVHDIRRVGARIESLLELRRWNEARPLVETLLAQRPDEAGLHALRAQCLLGQGDHAAALEAANRVIALAPEDEWGHRLCALVLGEMDLDQEAVRAADEAVRLAPDEWRTHKVFAEAAMDVPERSLDALRAAHEAVRLAPNEAVSHTTLGIVAQSRNDYTTAKAAYERALAIDPDQSAALNNLTVLQGTINLRRAVRGLAQSLRSDPHSEIARRNLDRLAMAFPLRLYAASVMALLAGLLIVRISGGPNPASWAVALLLLGGISAYAVLTAHIVPRSVRGYFGRRLVGSFGAWWNWFVCLAGVAIAVCTCLLPHGEVIGMIALRPILFGAVITGVMFVVNRSRA